MRTKSYIELEDGRTFKRISYQEREDTFNLIKKLMRNSKSLVPVVKEKESGIITRLNDFYGVNSSSELLGQDKENYENLLQDDLSEMYSEYDSSNYYHLIYRNGEEFFTNDYEILSTGKLPKFTDVVYMYFADSFDEQDTEIGIWPFGDGNHFEEQDFETREDYKYAIQKKFNTLDYRKKVSESK